MKSQQPRKKLPIEKKIRKWLLAEDKHGWQRKWGWFGYIRKDIIKLMEKIIWKEDQNTFTIIKKIQIIIIETMQECWLRRCKKTPFTRTKRGGNQYPKRTSRGKMETHKYKKCTETHDTTQ